MSGNDPKWDTGRLAKAPARFSVIIMSSSRRPNYREVLQLTEVKNKLEHGRQPPGEIGV